jgi:hypothetical protein
MSITETFLLLTTGILAGIASTVASIASVVSYPVLLAIGLPPLAANVTNTMSLICTAAGAGALLLAPARTFAIVVPVLIAGASVLLLIQPRLRGLAPRPGAERSRRRLAGLRVGDVHRLFRRGRRNRIAGRPVDDVHRVTHPDECP